MADYLFAVQDVGGREIVSHQGSVSKVGDVTVEHVSNKVTLLVAGKEVDSALWEGTGDLMLHRWPAEDKLSAPVSHPVR